MVLGSDRITFTMSERICVEKDTGTSSSTVKELSDSKKTCPYESSLIPRLAYLVKGSVSTVVSLLRGAATHVNDFDVKMKPKYPNRCVVTLGIN